MMNLSSSNFRFVGILSLLLIVVAIVVLMNLGGENDVSRISSAQGGDAFLQSFSALGNRDATTVTDPCTLISLNQIAEELELSLEDAETGVVGNPMGERYCRISNPDDQDTDLFYLSMVFNSAIDPIVIENNFNVENWYGSRKASPELIQIIDDLGNEAFWGGSGNELWNGLHILVYDVYLNVNVYSGNEEVDYRVAREVAVTVMEELFPP
jgi:hypothetical protein